METKVFSDDVIQRIASGNETTQTRISLDMLKKVLSPHQMRNVLGGSGGNGPEIHCTCECEDVQISGTCAGSSIKECEEMECAHAFLVCESPKCDYVDFD